MAKLKVLKLFTKKFNYYKELTLEHLLWDNYEPICNTTLPDGEYVLRTNTKGQRINFYVIDNKVYVLSNKIREIYEFDYDNNNLIPYFRMCEYQQLKTLKHLLTKKTIFKLELFEWWLDRRQTQREIYFLTKQL